MREKPTLLAMAGAVALAAFLVPLAACDGPHANAVAAANASPGAPGPIQAPTAAPPAPGPASPVHAWAVHENGEYGYAGELSDDDRKAGVAVSRVIMFRYLGAENGLYRLESIEAGFIATCANPCQVIKLMSGYTGATEHVTFNPDSVIGEAFVDAMNGQLEIYGAQPVSTPGADVPPAAAAMAPPPVASPVLAGSRQVVDAEPHPAPTSVSASDAETCAHGDPSSEITIDACDRKDIAAIRANGH